MATPIPQNQAAFTLREIVAATGGALMAGSLDAAVRGVSTDSRAVAGGALFVALRGESFDGHTHVAAASRAGAVAALVEHDVPAPGGEMALVRVASTLEALGALARAHARRWREAGDKRVVAITGSAGKTTTRVATTALAEAVRPGAVLSTRGNLNNRVGLPMTLLGLEAHHDVAVVELGMNQPGEIAALAAIAEPDVGVVTLVAAAHTELLGSIQGVADEKGALLRALGPGGVAIGNADDPNVVLQLARAGASRRVTYGRSASALLRVASRDPIGMTISRVVVARPDGSSVDFETPLLGEAGALASAAAIAVVEEGLGAKVTREIAARAFAQVEVGAGAGRLVPRLFEDGLALIDDSYNANPASMKASIVAAAEIAQLTGRRLVLVLGEMRELGDLSDAAHDEVGRVAAASGADAVVAVMGKARRIAEAARAAGLWAEFRDDVGEATNVVTRTVTRDDLVLVKGSRGVATEAIVRVLAEVHQAAPTTRRPFSSRPPADDGPNAVTPTPPPSEPADGSPATTAKPPGSP